MSFVPAIRDYIEMLNNVFDSLSGNINSEIIIKETLVYLFVSLKSILTSFFTFQWLRNVSYFPILVPQLQSSVLNETYFLHNPVSTIFTFLETPLYNNNKLVLGFLNSFFFCLPTSCAHVICARRLFLQGLPAGIAAGLGTILGQWWFATCILFGLRCFIIPWFSFEPLNFLIGFGLLFYIIIEISHNRSFYRVQTKEKTKLYRFFLLNLILSWTEQSCYFQYFGNLTFGPEPTALEIFYSNTEIQSFVIDGSYLLGLLAGSFFFTGLFGFVSIRLSNFIFPLLKYTLSRWLHFLHFGFFSLTMAFTYTLLPYYGYDYLFAGPLGFISQDKALDNTLFSMNTLENYAGEIGLFSYIPGNGFNFDLKSFDRGIYLNTFTADLDESTRKKSFEDFNYRAENGFLHMMSKQRRTVAGPDKARKRYYGLRNFFVYVFNKLDARYNLKKGRHGGFWTKFLTVYKAKNGETEISEFGHYIDTDRVPDKVREIVRARLKEKSSSDNNENTDYLIYEQNVSVNSEERKLDKLQKRLAYNENHFGEKALELKDAKIFDNDAIGKNSNQNVQNTFFAYRSKPKYDAARMLQKVIKESRYLNPVSQSLLSFQIDSFLSNSPTFQKLTNSQEKNLFTKRMILSTYYDTLRYYNQLPYIKDFKEFCNGSKSYADRVYNQQFKGTLKIVRNLFSITVGPDPEKKRRKIFNRPTQWDSVLQFDQPLDLNSISIESNSKPFHEELSHKKVQKTHFLEISNSTPFYAGWDQGLRKLVITNRLLGRSFAGDAPYSPPKMKGKEKMKGNEYRTLANFLDSNKKIEFTTWPFSKLTLEKTDKSLSNIPYNLLFESLKDPLNEPLVRNLFLFFEFNTNQPAETFPPILSRRFLNPEQVEKVKHLNEDPTRMGLMNEDEDEIGLKQIIPPNKGGFIWPGNSPLKFNFASKFERYEKAFKRFFFFFRYD